jgi:hypothetical protein
MTKSGPWEPVSPNNILVFIAAGKLYKDNGMFGVITLEDE